MCDILVIQFEGECMRKDKKRMFPWIYLVTTSYLVSSQSVEMFTSCDTELNCEEGGS